MLDDKSKEVRRVAIDLLACLPASPFVARMIARAASLLEYKRGGLLSSSSLDVTLPPESDAAAVRDGLDPKAFGNQKKLGEKAVLLVLILSVVPLQHWTSKFQRTPSKIVKAAQRNEFAAALATGFAWAALRQRDADWAEALLDAAVQPHAEFLPAESLLSVLPEDARATRLAAALRAATATSSDSGTWQAIAAVLGAFPGELPTMLASQVLTALRTVAASGIPWHLRATAESLVLRLPRAMLVEAAGGWPIDKDGVAPLVGLISFRHDAISALSES
jgi:hypothetical protein